MIKRISKCNKTSFARFFRRWDFSHSDFTLDYESQHFCSAITGIFFILYIILGIYLVAINFKSFINYKEFTLQYYTMNSKQTGELALNNTSTTFAFGLDCGNKTKNNMINDLLDIKVQYRVRTNKTDSGTIKKDFNFTNLKYCNEGDFLDSLSNYFEKQPIDLQITDLYCLNKQELENHELTGIYTDDAFTYISITALSKNESEEHLKNVSNYLSKNDCKLQYYYTDIILQLNEKEEPFKYFIDSIFLQLNPGIYNKKNIFYMNYSLSDSQILNLFDKDNYSDDPQKRIGISRIYDYFQVRGPDSSNTEFAKMYLRADNRKIEIKRHYQNIMEFYADNSIIKDLFEILCFTIGILTKYLDKKSLQKRLFILDDNDTNLKNKINNIK